MCFCVVARVLCFYSDDFDPFEKRTPLDEADSPLQRHKYNRKHKRLQDLLPLPSDLESEHSHSSVYIPPEADAIPVDVSAGELCAVDGLVVARVGGACSV